jgi:primosomal protein N''
MKIAWTVLLLALCASPAWCEDIGEVFQRSQAARLAALPPAGAEIADAQALHQSFARLQRELVLPSAVELRVVASGAEAETLDGRVVVLNHALGELPEIARLFLIAHELGHVAAAHLQARIELYRRHIPGQVVQEQTDAVADVLGREASEQAHAQEFEADGYAMRALLDLGYSQDELLDMFMRLGHHGSTATHPATGKRVAHLRLIEQERLMATAGPPGASPVLRR